MKDDELARELRALADWAHSKDERAILLRAAEAYDRLAACAPESAKGHLTGE